MGKDKLLTYQKLLVQEDGELKMKSKEQLTAKKFNFQWFSSK